MVSQFTSPDKVGLLCDIDFDFPAGTHAIGRLDNESEGLLILTTNKKITRLLFSGPPHKRVYLVMVQNVVSAETLEILRRGVSIKIKGGGNYKAIPEEIKIINKPGDIYMHSTDSREQYPHTWLLITLSEGKFRQVRKIVLAIRHRCLRLIRISIDGLALGDLKPGQVLELPEEVFCELTGINLQ